MSEAFATVDLRLVIELPVGYGSPDFERTDGPDDPQRAEKVRRNIVREGYSEFQLLDEQHEFALPSSLSASAWNRLALDALNDDGPSPDPDYVSALPGGSCMICDDRLVLYPQCCAYLDWGCGPDWAGLKNGEDGWVGTGHPMAWMAFDGERTHFDCEEFGESFPSDVPARFTVPTQALREAIDRLVAEHEQLKQQLRTILPYDDRVVNRLVGFS